MKWKTEVNPNMKRKKQQEMEQNDCTKSQIRRKKTFLKLCLLHPQPITCCKTIDEFVANKESRRKSKDNSMQCHIKA